MSDLTNRLADNMLADLRGFARNWNDRVAALNPEELDALQQRLYPQLDKLSREFPLTAQSRHRDEPEAQPSTEPEASPPPPPPATTPLAEPEPVPAPPPARDTEPPAAG